MVEHGSRLGTRSAAVRRGGVIAADPFERTQGLKGGVSAQSIPSWPKRSSTPSKGSATAVMVL